MKTTPYELVFGQPPTKTFFPGASDALPSSSKKGTNKKRPLPNSPSPKPVRKSRRVNEPSTTQPPPSKPENRGETKQTAVDVEEISETSPQPDISKWIPTLLLDENDKKILEDGRWLNDKHMYAAQHLLKSQFPHISGLQPTILGKARQWEVMTSEGVQIINQANSHWICVSTIGCAPDMAYFYDSMLYNKSRLHPQVTKDIASLVHAAGDCIDVIVPQSQLQEGTDNCGLFAIATATSLCFGIPPSTVLWNQKKMREHLRRCFESGKMSPFPGWDLPDRRKITPHISDEPLGWATAHYGQSESLLFLQDATGWEREDGSVYQMPEVVPREMWRYSQDCVLQEQENSLLLQVLLEHVVRGNFPFFHVTSCCINCYKLIANIAQVVSILRNRRAQFQNCACTCAIQNCPGNIDRFENAQRNFENAQISIMRGTYIMILSYTTYCIHTCTLHWLR